MEYYIKSALCVLPPRRRQGIAWKCCCYTLRSQGVKLIRHISPLGSMDLLSQLEVDMLKSTASSDLYCLFRNCSLAVLNFGSQTDNSKELLSRYEDFDINVLRRERGVKLERANHLGRALPEPESGKQCPHYQSGIFHFAQCACTARRGRAQHGGVLGRPLHQ